MSADIVGDLRRVEAERDALRAAVERVRALLGEPVGPLLDTFARNKIRAALDGDD